MFKEKAHTFLLSCTLITLASAVLQYLNPSLTLFDGGLIVAILLTVFLKNDRYTFLFGTVGMVLVCAAAFYDTGAPDRWHLLFQHLFSLLIVVLAVIFVLYVKRLYRSIEADQEQVNALFEHATEGIILTDEKGKIVLLNPSATRMFHYLPGDLPGRPIDLLIPKRYHHSHEQHREQFYRQPGSREMGHGRDLFARRKDGSEFPVEVSLSYYRQKGILFVIAFVVDISERKQTEQELINRQEQLESVTADVKRMNTELEAKVEQRTLVLREALKELESSQEELHEALSKEKELGEIKSRFVTMASHEFRTPLSTVLSSANLIARYTATEDQDKRDKHIRRIKDAVKHLNDLLEDFLSLGRLEEGHVKVEYTHFSVRDFVGELVEEMQPVLKPGQRIVYEIQDPIGEGHTDKRLLKNILTNLLGNAAKFSSEDEQILLNIRSSVAGGLSMSVIDKGIGISFEDQQHLFSSFFRGSNVLNIEGTGLGLHIVRRYLDLLQGSIRVESVLGMGTTMTIELPDASV